MDATTCGRRLVAGHTHCAVAHTARATTAIARSDKGSSNPQVDHHQNRNWLYDVNFIDRSEGFHTDLGYVPRVNMRQAQQFYMRRFHPN
jgi:hypothetical protein